MLKRIADAWGRKKQDSGRFAPAPVLKVDNALFSTPEAPESDGAGTLTSLDDPWKKLEEQADKEHLNAEEWNKLLLEHYPEQTYPDQHRAMLIRESIEPRPSGSSKVGEVPGSSPEGDNGSVFM